MNKEALEAEKAEFIQSVKALLIPLSLFLACVVMAAGTFLIYNGESCGWGFVVVATATVIIAFAALIRFQNKYRARGVIRSNSAEEVLVSKPARVVRLTMPTASSPAPPSVQTGTPNPAQISLPAPPVID